MSTEEEGGELVGEWEEPVEWVAPLEGCEEPAVEGEEPLDCEEPAEEEEPLDCEEPEEEGEEPEEEGEEPVEEGEEPAEEGEEPLDCEVSVEEPEEEWEEPEEEGEELEDAELEVSDGTEALGAVLTQVLSRGSYCSVPLSQRQVKEPWTFTQSAEPHTPGTDAHSSSSSQLRPSGAEL